MDVRYDVFLEAAKDIGTELVALRRHLRRNPELSWSEHATSAHVRGLLHESGIPTVDGMAAHGFYTDVHQEMPGRRVAWRADMDALPVDDKVETGYASLVPGCSHACGHDVHTTVAYGIARVLHAHKNLADRPIRVFWQPAEESLPSGAPAMIADGVLANVESVMAMHCDPTRSLGTFGIRPGVETAAVDTFVIAVEAQATAHSARPYTGKDTIWILNQILSYLYSFGERTTDVRHPSVLSVCQINGGHAHNVIPKLVRCSGTIRTTSSAQRLFYRESIERYLHLMGEMHGVQIHFELIEGAPPVVNNAVLALHGQQSVRRILGEQALDEGEPSLGAEDFAYYQQHIPGLFIRVGTSSGPSTSHPLHSSYFDIDEAAIVPTVALMAALLATSPLPTS